MLDVTAAIIEKDGRFLAAQRLASSHLGGLWEFPGGKIEPPESPGQCLQRELEEEFGIQVEIGTHLATSIYDYGTKVVRLMGFHVHHLGGDFVLHAHAAIRWLTAEELDSVQWAPADVALVSALRQWILKDLRGVLFAPHE